MNRKILFLFGFIFAAGQEMIAIYVSCCIIIFSVFVEMQLLYISGLWAAAVSWWDLQTRRICGFQMYMQITRDSSVSCMCFQITVCPHRVGRVLYRNIAWFQNEYAYQKCIYVYVCIFIYSCAGINRWLYVRVFGLKSEWIQNKAVLWIGVLADNVTLVCRPGNMAKHLPYLSIRLACAGQVLRQHSCNVVEH